jgi:hypothetical protein
MTFTKCAAQDRRGVDLISDALPFGGLWYGEPDATSNAVGYAKFFSRSHHAVICLQRFKRICLLQRFEHFRARTMEQRPMILFRQIVCAFASFPLFPL